MNQQLTDNEIEKVIEHLNYSNKSDVMAQRLFFDQTEIIRQQRINNEKIIEVLKIIASDNPSEVARKEASSTLTFLGITPPVNGAMNETPISIGQAITIGLVAGIILDLVFYGLKMGKDVVILLMPPLICITIPGLIFSVVGAIIGNNYSKPRLTVWIGAVLGTIIGIVVVSFVVNGLPIFW